MSDDVEIPIVSVPAEEPIPFAAPGRRGWRGRNGGGDGGPPGDGRSSNGGPPHKPRLRKLRFLLILTGIGALAFISTVFGMMMAVASDVPQLENRQQYRLAANSFLYDDHWRPIGILAPPNHVVIDQPFEISQSMKNAIVAVEDRRFWSEPGVDIRGIARAFLADVTGGSRQGASTIAQQFVKNALSEQNNRTVFEKLREAALAYHLTRKWSKQKILTEYLNSIYFGNGAYGVESAARVYFGKAHGFDTTIASTNQSGQSAPGCGDSASNLPRPKCASVLAPWEAALLAGMVASPATFDPIAHPDAARARRAVVLRDMLQQRYVTYQQYQQGLVAPLPTANDLQQPTEPSAAPYFTSWLRPQILAAMGLGRGIPASVAEYRAYYGGLKIRTSLDLQMQQAAEQAISSNLPSGSGLPTASLVAIDNKTGEVRAMVGGPVVNGQEDFAHQPFNLATEGHRQPGSAFKPFTLAMALESGQYTPDSIIESAPQDFIVPNSGGKEHFIVHNFGNTYSGPITLTQATTISDNSVYSQVGIHVGTARIARFAKRMGIRSDVSNNYAMILGGLKVGVSPLDLAHAYESFATGGNKVYNPHLGAPEQGPTGIAQIQCPKHVCGSADENIIDKPTYKRLLPAGIASTVHDILTTVVQSGTGTAAAISGVDVAGKTGTTTNYGDAWFVGWTPQLTTAVWVGYPNKLVPMTNDYNGGPVEGGTYPAVIWHDFVSQALQILQNEQPQSSQTTTTTTDTTGSAATAPGGSGSGATTTGPSGSGGNTANGTANGGGGNHPAGAGGGTGNGAGATGGAGGTAGAGGGSAPGGGGNPPAGGGGGGTAGGGSGSGSGNAGSGGSGSGSGGAGVP
jgi:penicillin-binding protein 1A